MNYLHEFVLHASLDNIDEAIWTTQSCYLKQVDRYYDLTVSAYATSSLVKFLLLHDSKNDDGIRSFFHDIHEYYIKVSEPSFSVLFLYPLPAALRGRLFMKLTAQNTPKPCARSCSTPSTRRRRR